MKPTPNRAIPPLRSVALWLLASAFVHAELSPALAQDSGGVHFSSESYAAFEDHTELTVTVVRWGGTQAFSVDYETSDGTAQAGTDYLARSGTLSFGEGEATKTIVVPIRDDDLAEGPETLRLSLSNPSRQVAVGEPSEATLWILDDEPGAMLWDRTFAPRFDGQEYSAAVRAIALQADGKILISGDFEKVDGVPRAHVARLNADGSLDPAFDVGLGPRRTDQCSYGLPSPLLVSDGAIFVGGNFTSFHGAVRTGIAKLDATGALDVNFHPELEGGPPGSAGCGAHISAIAIQADGKVVIGGVFWSVNGTRRGGIARLHADGTLDPSFNPSPFLRSQGEAVALQEDDRGVVSGYLTRAGGGLDDLRRLSADGSVDLSFDPKFPGAGTGGWLNALTLDPEGKVLVSGLFTRVDGTPRGGIVRLNPDGSVDATFDPGTGATHAFGAAAWVASIAVQPDGKILLNGDFEFFNGLRRGGLARLHADGSLDTSFRLDASSEPTFHFGRFDAPMVVAPDGKVLIGARQTWNETESNGIFRLHSGLTIRSVGFTSTDVLVGESGGSATATVERIGNPGGPLTVDYVTLPGSATPGVDYVEQSGTLSLGPGEASRTITIRILDDVIVEGRETILLTLRNPSPGALLGSEQTTVLTINDDESPGSVDLSFNPPAGTTVGGSEIAWAIAFLPLVVQPNGKIWVGGVHTGMAAIAFGGRLNPDGSLDAAWGASPDLFPEWAGARFHQALGVQSDGAAIVFGLRPDLIGFGSAIGLSKVNLDGSLDPTFGTLPTDGDDAYCCYHGSLVGAVQPDDRILFLRPVRGLQYVTRLTAGGGPDPGFKLFDWDQVVYVRAISFQPDGGIILAGTRYAVADGRALPELLRLLPDGAVDASFVPKLTPRAGDSPSSFIGSVLVQADGRLIVRGDFAIGNDPSRDNLARLNSDGSLDTSFAPPAALINQFWTAAALQADGKIMLANVRDRDRTTLTRLNPDGSLDASFDLETADGRIEQMVFQPDGRLLIAGYFSEINGVRRRNLARLNFPPPFRFDSVGRTETGVVRLSLSVQPGRDYVLEVSTNLTTWAPQLTNIASGTSLVFEEPVGATFPQRFYRARLR